MTDADVRPRSALLLEPDRNQIEIFVDAMFRHAGSEGYVSIRSFLGDNAVFRISTAKLKGGLRHLIDVAEDDARRAANDAKPVVFCPPLAVFNSPDGWRARQEDLLKGLALSVECDERPDEALSKLEELLGPTTLIVKSGGQWIDPDDRPRDKLHLHWRLSRPAMGDQLAKLKQARRLAAAIVGADTSNVPTVHCLRWPGSWHRKSGARLCHIAAAAPDVEIDLDEALSKLEAAAPDTAEGNGLDTSSEAKPEDWGALAASIIAGTKLHKSIAELAAKYARSGTPVGAGINQARALMEASAARYDRPADWKDRFDDIPRAFDTAYDKFSEQEPPEPPQPASARGPPPPPFSDEALALTFAERHARELRYVAQWGQWLSWAGTHWRPDTTLRAFDLARAIARETAATCKQKRTAIPLASAKTVAAVERLAKADRRMAAADDQWDGRSTAFNTPTRGG